MKSKYLIITIGAFITLAGIGMFFFGVSMFTYQGPPLSDFQNKAGKYSFIYFLPVFLIGLVLFIFGLTMGKEKR